MYRVYSVVDVVEGSGECGKGKCARGGVRVEVRCARGGVRVEVRLKKHNYVLIEHFLLTQRFTAFVFRNNFVVG
eukprot:CFRG6124T1